MSRLFIVLWIWWWAFLVASQVAGSNQRGLSCDYIAGQKESDPPESEATQEVREMLDRVTLEVGLEGGDFVLRAGDVPSAKAFIRDEDRKIVYNPAFLERLRGTAEAQQWGALSVLAHEVAHHLKGHSLKLKSTDRPRLELEADEHAGWTICLLGGTLQQAESALSHLRGRQLKNYPSLETRLEAASVGWTRALEYDKCPPEARQTARFDALTDLTNSEVVTQENVSDLLGKAALTAATIHFENVKVEVAHPLILLAERISFDASSVLRGRELVLIAQEIEGGLVDASGGEGGDGGRILIAASQIKNTVITANGGNGRTGQRGLDGRDGLNGQDGMDGDCGQPGGASTEATNGEDGRSGEPGKAGGQGGSGGEIALLVFHKDRVVVEVEPGGGGIGGRGGKGGRGGARGRGGRGCKGNGRQEPTWPDGTEGRDGSDGQDGPPGVKGVRGRIWERPISNLQAIKEALKGTDLNTGNRKLWRLAAPQTAWAGTE